MIAPNPIDAANARADRADRRALLAALIACAMTVAAVVAIAAPSIADAQREVRQRTAEQSIPARHVAASNP